MSGLVTALSERDRPIVVGGVEPTTTDFVARLTGLRYVVLRFTGTRGGTEVGFALDDTGTDLSGADLVAGSGRVRVAGDLTVDGVPVRCVADIDLTTLAGTGRLDLRR